MCASAQVHSHVYTRRLECAHSASSKVQFLQVSLFHYFKIGLLSPSHIKVSRKNMTRSLFCISLSLKAISRKLYLSNLPDERTHFYPCLQLMKSQHFEELYVPVIFTSKLILTEQRAARSLGSLEKTNSEFMRNAVLDFNTDEKYNQNSSQSWLKWGAASYFARLSCYCRQRNTAVSNFKSAFFPPIVLKAAFPPVRNLYADSHLELLQHNEMPKTVQKGKNEAR